MAFSFIKILSEMIPNANESPTTPFEFSSEDRRPLLLRQTGNHSRSSSRIGLSRRSVGYYDGDVGEGVGPGQGAIEIEEQPRDTPITINAQRNGLRDWYPDYTSIDWIHDSLKERIRVRALRRLSGMWGLWANAIDSLQGWFLLLITGITVGAIASLIDVGESLLLTWRDGFCSTTLWATKERCCRVSAPVRNQSLFNLNPFGPYNFPLPLSNCSDWVSWYDALGPAFDQQFYVCSAVFLSLIAVLITNLSVVVRVNSDTGKRSAKYHAAAGGIAEVKTILGGFVIRGYLGIKTLVTKVVGLIFSVSSGIMLGQQGPLVHISCCIGNIYSRLFLKYAKNEGKRREILSAASAAGVSVAFAAPIGGVLFSLEEVSYYFPMKTMWRSFFCSLMAAMTLKVLNPYGSGKLVKFQVVYSRDWVDFELVPFAFLGILGGLYGAFFIKITNAWANVRRSKYYPLHPVFEVIFVAFLTAAMNLQTPLMRLSLNEVKEVLFSECIVGGEDPYGLCQ
ncbi:UNVERIFIED_CONTAM: hypothetical protein HDU68_010465 [Siphonaria sp. JEL0065]|nr:hypothetical protein HDU68_010465 [Siphonaria sp. JEL0065]